jgi:arylsulfatase B
MIIMPHQSPQHSTRRSATALLLTLPLLALAGTITPAGRAAAQGVPSAAKAEAPVAHRPNVLIIVADDLGYADVGFNGASMPTPNIDRIARSGMVLDHFYVSPICSPSRAGLLTGRYPHRYGIMGDTITPGSDFGLDPHEETIAQVLGRAGYGRRAFLGKWHLGHRSPDYHPMHFGFTSFYGHLNGAIDYFTHEREGQRDWHRDRTPSNDKGHATDLLSDEAVRIIRTPSKDGSPWMMWLAYNAPHGPLQATEEDLAAVGFDPSKPRFGEEGAGGREGASYGTRGHGNTRRQTTLALIHGMDRGIGRILAALEQTGQLDNTLILFTSDNGGPRGPASNGPLRGGKFLHYDGGVRVAAAMSWPAGFKPRASANIGRISYVDLLPTIAGLTGASSSRELDGQDVSDALLSGRPLGDRALFVGEDYRTPAASNERGPTDPASLLGRTASMILGKWKLVGDQLYDLDVDPYEKQDVAAQHPEIVARLKARIAHYASLRRVPRERMNATHLPPIPLWDQRD